MSKSDKLIRVELRHDTSVGSSFMNIYIDDRFDLKLGDQITLQDSEDPDRLWTIDHIHEVVQRTDIKRGWNNNI